MVWKGSSLFVCRLQNTRLLTMSIEEIIQFISISTAENLSFLTNKCNHRLDWEQVFSGTSQSHSRFTHHYLCHFSYHLAMTKRHFLALAVLATTEKSRLTSVLGLKRIYHGGIKLISFRLIWGQNLSVFLNRCNCQLFLFNLLEFLSIKARTS